MAISKAEIKNIQSLQQKKFRQTYGKFLVEGDKAVRELLQSQLEVEAIYALKGWEAATRLPIITATQSELEQLATQQHPDQVLAVVYIPEEGDIAISDTSLYLVCDGLNDPGNAGTIIRIAHWFGIRTVFFSLHSVDVYNPKVVAAAKGSLFHTQVRYVDIPILLDQHSTLPVYGAMMNGESIYSTALPVGAFIVIGNEANGISNEVLKAITHRISIPAFGTAESLNVGVATGILIAEWRRQGMYGAF